MLAPENRKECFPSAEPGVTLSFTRGGSNHKNQNTRKEGKDDEQQHSSDPHRCLVPVMPILKGGKSFAQVVQTELQTSSCGPSFSLLFKPLKRQQRLESESSQFSDGEGA